MELHAALRGAGANGGIGFALSTFCDVIAWCKQTPLALCDACVAG
jgi:glycerate kinase